jgi:hypothetical protein
LFDISLTREFFTSERKRWIAPSFHQASSRAAVVSTAADQAIMALAIPHDVTFQLGEHLRNLVPIATGHACIRAAKCGPHARGVQRLAAPERA